MPDCSYITLTVAAEHGVKVRKVAEEMDLQATVELENPGSTELVWYDAPWGLSYIGEDNDDLDESLLARLRASGIPFTASDGGHSEAGGPISLGWGSYQIGWKPGMKRESVRSVSNEGSPLLTVDRWRTLRSLAGRDRDQITLAWIERYLTSDDPAAWLLPTTGRHE